MLLCPRRQSNQNAAGEQLRGAPSRSGRSKSPFPRPPVYGGGSLRRRKVRSIPDAQVWASVMPLPCSSSPHRTRFAGLRRGPQLGFSNIRRLVPAYLLGAAGIVPAPPTTAQLPRLSRVGGVISTQMTQNFRLCRPQWAGARRAVRPGFARRIKLPILQEGVPRKTGVWGRGVPRRHTPRAFLVPFWANKKEPAPQGGTFLILKK